MENISVTLPNSILDKAHQAQEKYNEYRAIMKSIEEDFAEQIGIEINKSFLALFPIDENAPSTQIKMV